MLDVNTITPALMVCNEEYWIHYALKDVLSVFPNVVVLDTGSTDLTLPIIKNTLIQAKRPPGAQFILEQVNYGHDANKIGNGRNILRSLVRTKWMFLIDGDEIWTAKQLKALIDSDIPDAISVVMAGSHNVEDLNGRLNFRTYDIANKDILFKPDVTWSRVDYPFEGYGLANTLDMSLVHYLPADKVYCYHMRHTQRSSQGAFFRDAKYHYFPYARDYHNFELTLLGEARISTPNPYVR